ncbi:MAG: glycosyltransferase 87 family protein [Terriglobales bacterium]
MTGVSQTLRRSLWLMLSVLSACSMWYYVAKVWSAGQPAQFSDLYAQWWGAHELLLHHRNPYTPAVAHEIQTVIYGSPVSASRPGDAAEISGGFAYPIYVVFLMWPTVHLAFPVVKSLAICLFLALTLASLWLWLYAFRWRPPNAEFGILAVLILGSFPVLQGLRLQNLSLLVAFLVAAAMASLAADYLALAGLLLAGATLKPQFVILLIPWLALWVMGDWRRRRRLAWSFSTATTALIVGGEILEPGWISGFLTIIRAYRQYTYGHSLLDVWFTPRGGPVVAAVLVLGVLALCWRCRSEPAQSPRFFLASSSVLAATLVVIPTLEPHSQLLLVPGVLFLLRYGVGIREAGKLERLFLIAAWILLAWAWVAAFGIMLAAIWLPAGTLLKCWLLPLYPSPLLPFGVLLVLGFVLGNDVKALRTRGIILES